MKKYTILDSSGQKKIVYAPNMKKALRYVGDGEKTTVKDSKFYVILSNYDYTKAQAEKDARKYGLKLQILGPANGSKQETEAYLVGPRANIVRMLKETDMDEFEGDIEDSVKDSKVEDEDDYFYFDADEDDRSLDDYKRIMKQCGLTITKVEGNNREAFIYYRGSSSAEQKAAKMLGISLEDSIKDADTNIVDKLISEEEKAVMDYKEALMADSDLSANAVYAHILAEELEHLRELRSLREQPSLGDSIKDAEYKTYKTVGYFIENGYYTVYVRNRVKYNDSYIRHYAEELGLEASRIGSYTSARPYHPPYASEYAIKGKNKNAIIKMCEMLDPKSAPLKLDSKDSLIEQSLDDSVKDEVQTAETYANTGWIEKLASDLLNEGQKNGYDFDAVLKKFDSLSKQILVIVKNALDKAKKEVVDYNDIIRQHIEQLSAATEETSAHTEEALNINEINKEKMHKTQEIMDELLKVAEQLVL